ncbi:uncharacterized protein [Mytilus edulis]|uniref:uncharacterized protein n=1 Tax=Mytilus edulis TaxID=6550 RepID=UPI0039EF7EC5
MMNSMYPFQGFNGAAYYQPSFSPMFNGQQQVIQQQAAQQMQQVIQQQAAQQMQQACQQQFPQQMQQVALPTGAQQIQQFPQSYENLGMAAQSLQNILGAVSNSIGGIGNQDTISLQLKVLENGFDMKFEKGLGKCCNCASAIEQT